MYLFRSIGVQLILLVAAHVTTVSSTSSKSHHTRPSTLGKHYLNNNNNNNTLYGSPQTDIVERFYFDVDHDFDIFNDDSFKASRLSVLTNNSFFKRDGLMHYQQNAQTHINSGARTLANATGGDEQQQQQVASDSQPSADSGDSVGGSSNPNANGEATGTGQEQGIIYF